MRKADQHDLLLLPLSQRQKPKPCSLGINRQQGSGIQFHLHLAQSQHHMISDGYGSEIFSAYLCHAWLLSVRDSQSNSEVQIVGQDDKPVRCGIAMMAGSGVMAGPTSDQWIASMPASFSTLAQLGERFMPINIFMRWPATLPVHRSAMQRSAMPA